jgi:hypothetical protein
MMSSGEVIMNANLPKFMSIKDFCAYTGYSRYQFMRLADRARIPTQQGSDGRSRVVDVQQAIAAIEALPEEHKEVPRYLRPGCAVQLSEETQEAE